MEVDWLLVRPCVPIVPGQPAEHFASVPCNVARKRGLRARPCEDILLAVQNLKARQTIARLEGVATALAQRSENVGHFGHPREHFEQVPLFRSTCCGRLWFLHFFCQALQQACHLHFLAVDPPVEGSSVYISSSVSLRQLFLLPFSNLAPRCPPPSSHPVTQPFFLPPVSCTSVFPAIPSPPWPLAP